MRLVGSQDEARLWFNLFDYMPECVEMLEQRCQDVALHVGGEQALDQLYEDDLEAASGRGLIHDGSPQAQLCYWMRAQFRERMRRRRGIGHARTDVRDVLVAGFASKHLRRGAAASAAGEEEQPAADGAGTRDGQPASDGQWVEEDERGPEDGQGSWQPPGISRRRRFHEGVSASAPAASAGGMGVVDGGSADVLASSHPARDPSLLPAWRWMRPADAAAAAAGDPRAAGMQEEEGAAAMRDDGDDEYGLQQRGDSVRVGGVLIERPPADLAGGSSDAGDAMQDGQASKRSSSGPRTSSAGRSVAHGAGSSSGGDTASREQHDGPRRDLAATGGSDVAEGRRGPVGMGTPGRQRAQLGMQGTVVGKKQPTSASAAMEEEEE